MLASRPFAVLFCTTLLSIHFASAADYTPPDKDKALVSVKAMVAEVAKSGQKTAVWVQIGTPVKAELVSSNDKVISVSFEGNPFTFKWEKLPQEQIATIVKSLAQDDLKRALLGMDFCMATGQLSKAEEFMALASANSKMPGDELKVRIKALASLKDAAKAASSPAPVATAAAAKADKDAEPASYKGPEKIAYRPSEYDALNPVKDVAAAVDNVIEIGLADLGIHPEPLCDDAAFLRRSMLDITGEIPAPEEVIKFLQQSGSANKRVKLIDELVKRPGYADHWATFWSVLLVGRRTREEPDVKPHFFRSWLRDELARNEKFDKIVTAMLTATGDNDKDGPSSYLTFHMNDTLPIAVGHISQTFLGARISCAQCHDHPFDKWTQQDFWGFSAFLANTRSERKELREDPNDPMVVTRSWHVLVDSDERNGGGNYDPPQPELRLPPKVLDGPIFTSSAVHATDGRPRRKRSDPGTDSAAAKPMDKSKDKSMDMGMDKGMDMAAMMSMDDNSMMKAAAGNSGTAGLLYRKAFAAWITSPKNEKFSQSAVNRIWRNMFGIGLVEPVDDIRPKNPPVYPEAMKILADDFTASGHDLQRLVTIIANTRAYQRSSIGTLQKADRVKEVKFFARAEVRPMTPEELFMAVVKSTAGDEKAKSLEEAMRKYDADMRYGAKKMDKKDGMMGMKDDSMGGGELTEMNNLMQKFIGTSTAEDRAGKLQFEGTVSQALMMMHNAFMQNYIKQGVKRYGGDMTWLFATTLGRPPTPEEASAFSSMSGDAEGILWVLLNSAEFVTIH